MEFDWSNEWNRRLFTVLNRTSIVEVGLLAARDVEAALSYERRLLDSEIEINKFKATCYQQMAR